MYVRVWRSPRVHFALKFAAAPSYAIVVPELETGAESVTPPEVGPSQAMQDDSLDILPNIDDVMPGIELLCCYNYMYLQSAMLPPFIQSPSQILDPY